MSYPGSNPPEDGYPPPRPGGGYASGSSGYPPPSRVRAPGYPSAPGPGYASLGGYGQSSGAGMPQPDLMPQPRGMPEQDGGYPSYGQPPSDRPPYGQRSGGGMPQPGLMPQPRGMPEQDGGYPSYGQPPSDRSPYGQRSGGGMPQPAGMPEPDGGYPPYGQPPSYPSPYGQLSPPSPPPYAAPPSRRSSGACGPLPYSLTPASRASSPVPQGGYSGQGGSYGTDRGPGYGGGRESDYANDRGGGYASDRGGSYGSSQGFCYGGASTSYDAGRSPSYNARSGLTGGAYKYYCQGTLRPYPNFDARQDAQALRKAMKGWGTDEDTIINILCSRSSTQRLEIVSTFKQMLGRDLIKDIKSELSGNFKSVMVGLLYPMHEYLARELRSAMKGLGTDEDCLVEILCTRSNDDIRRIKDAFHEVFGRDLEADIRSETSGHFRKLLVSMCNANREEGIAPDPGRARNDAHLLQQAGIQRWGTDESVFNQILASQSYEQLLLVFREYNALTNQTIVESISREMSGDLRRGFLAIAKCVNNIPFYFAEKLYKSMKGLGTSDKALIRIVVSRCEVDMVQIKEEFVRNYKTSLDSFIKSDTSGDYRKALLALVVGN